MFFFTILLSAAGALGSTIPRASTISVTYRWESTSNARGLYVVDAADSVVGSACSQSLDAGQFSDAPIAFAIDHSRPWEGTVSIGKSNYSFLPAELAGEGPTCGVAYNADVVEVQCHMAYTPSIGSSFAAHSDAVQCLAQNPAAAVALTGLSWVDTSRASASNLSLPAEEALETRNVDGGAGTIKRNTDVVGDGNPHQDGWHYQCTEPNHCGPTTCSAAITKATAFTWAFMAAVTPFKWISAGFNVGQSYTSSETHTCNAMANQQVCVWHNEIYTAYTVNNQITVCSSFGCANKKPQTFVLSSPNSNNIGSGFYCVINTCRGKGEGYFDNGPAGPAPK